MEQNQLKELAEGTRKILQTLNPLEAKIVRLSFGLEEKKPKTDAEIAKSLGIPAPFVEEYRTRALRKLRHPAHSEALRDYLNKKPIPLKHVGVVVPQAIEEIRRLSPELLDRLRSKTNDIGKLKADVFEHLVAELLASRGFHDVRMVGRNQKTSADILAAKHVSDVGEHRYFVEVKRWKDRIGVEVIDRVYGVMLSERKDFGWSAGMVVSVVGFKKFRKYTVEDIRNLGIFLKDRDDLLQWLNEYKESENGLWIPDENRKGNLA